MNVSSLKKKLDRHLAYLEQDKSNPHLLLTTGLLKARILHHEQQVPEAIALLEQLILNNESNPDITGLLSLLYFDNQDAVKANLLSNKTLALDSTNYEAQLTQLLLQALENNASLDDINGLINIQPLDSRLWFILGATQMRYMNFTAAVQAFEQTTAIHPNFYDSWICAGWCYLLKNDLIRAQSSYQQAIKIDSQSAEGFGGLSLIYALHNQMMDAKKELKKAEQLDPRCFLAAITRIIIANQSNLQEAAIEFNKTFSNIAPEINQIITQAILNATTKKETIH